jgi:hypothetical protein
MRRTRRVLNRWKGLKTIRMLSDGTLRLTFSIEGTTHAARSEMISPGTPVYGEVLRAIGPLQPGQIYLLEPLNGYQKLPPDPVAIP